MRNKVSNILVVAPLRFPKIEGGVDRMITSLVKELTCHHKNITVLLPANWNEPIFSFSGKELNADIYRFKFILPLYSEAPVKSFISWLVSFPFSLYKLWRLCKKRNVDIVHLHMAKDFYYFFAILRFVGGPKYVLTLHGSDVNEFNAVKFISKALINFTLKLSSGTVAVSKDLRERAKPTFPNLKEIRCIYNGIDLTEYETRSYTQKLASNLPENYFVTIGSFDPYKGQDIAIKAWRYLTQNDVFLVVIGEGILADAYVELAKKLQILDKIIFTGQLPHSEAMEITSRALGLIAPSRKEGLGYVLIEAGALGVPVICSNIPPFLEIITDRVTGRVFTSESDQELASIILETFHNRYFARELGIKLKHKVKEQFDTKSMTSQYLHVYNSALTK